MTLFAHILLAALASPQPDADNALSHIQVDDRSIQCEKSQDAVPNDGPRLAAPCDVDSWEVRVVGTYPKQALRDEVSGTIRVYGIVTPDGRLTDCARNTLGNPWVLGGRICETMSEYARFNAARGADGATVAQPVSLLVTYVLPDWPQETESFQKQATPRDIERWLQRIQENIPSTPIRRDLSGTVGLRVLVDRKGRVARCLVTQSSEKSITDQAACLGMERYARFEPALDAQGKPTLGVYETKITFRLY